MMAIETLPVVWDAERDEAFFRLVADLFSASFTAGASVLLASNGNDADLLPAQPAAIPYQARHGREQFTR